MFKHSVLRNHLVITAQILVSVNLSRYHSCAFSPLDLGLWQVLPNELLC
jgi:hypothetical protein